MLMVAYARLPTRRGSADVFRKETRHADNGTLHMMKSNELSSRGRRGRAVNASFQGKEPNLKTLQTDSTSVAPAKQNYGDRKMRGGCRGLRRGRVE